MIDVLLVINIDLPINLVSESNPWIPMVHCQVPTAGFLTVAGTVFDRATSLRVHVCDRSIDRCMASRCVMEGGGNIMEIDLWHNFVQN